MKFNKMTFDVISSTNDEGKKRIEKEALVPTLILAKQQLNGRGRGNHRWESSHIGDIYSSYCFALGLSIKEAPQLTLISSLGIIRALIGIFEKRHLFEYELSIKWPNDILLNGKKIVGILTELAQNGLEYYAIVGVGINVCSKSSDLLQKGLPYAGSIAELMNEDIRFDEVQEAVEYHLGEIFDDFLNGARFRDYDTEYNRFLLNRNKTLLYEVENKTRTGFCLGMDENGYLLIRNHFGEVDKIGFGEVNIKGVYGY